MKKSALLLLNGKLVECNTNAEMDSAIEEIEKNEDVYFYVVISRIDDQIAT